LKDTRGSRAGITSEEARYISGDLYKMVLSAATRARELKQGAAKKVITDSGPSVTAMEEIEAGVIPGDYFYKTVFKSEKKQKNDG